MGLLGGPLSTNPCTGTGKQGENRECDSRQELQESFGFAIKLQGPNLRRDNVTRRLDSFVCESTFGEHDSTRVHGRAW